MTENKLCYRAKGEYRENPAIVRGSKTGMSPVMVGAIEQLSSYLDNNGYLVLNHFKLEGDGDKVYHVQNPVPATVVVSRWLGATTNSGSYDDATFSDGTLQREIDRLSVEVISGQESNSKRVLEAIINSVENKIFADRLEKSYTFE